MRTHSIARRPVRHTILLLILVALGYAFSPMLTHRHRSKSRLTDRAFDAVLLTPGGDDHSQHPTGQFAARPEHGLDQEFVVVDRDTMARLEGKWRHEGSNDWEQGNSYQIPQYDGDVPIVTRTSERTVSGGKRQGKSRLEGNSVTKSKIKVDSGVGDAEAVDRDRDTSPQSTSSSLEADLALCGMSPCRVLMPGWIGEQESRAQQHFIQLGLLTSTLNAAYRHHQPSNRRITSQEGLSWGPYVLVLPNVSKSRMGSCFKHPFQFYYDVSPEALGNLGIGRTVTFEQFQEWVEKREIRPKAQVVQVEQNARDVTMPISSDADVVEVYSGGGAPAGLVYDMEVAPEKGRHNYCLDEKAPRLAFSRHRPQLTVFPPSQPVLWHKTRQSIKTMQTAIAEALGVRANGSPLFVPDVFVVNWELRWPVLPWKRPNKDTVKAISDDSQHQLVDPATIQADQDSEQRQQHLSYNPRWTRFATTASTQIAPYLAVHWRMETVPPGPLLQCASALVHSIHELLTMPNNGDIQTVYLATDFPLEGDHPKSGTWKGREVVEEHRQAMHVLFDAFGVGGVLEGWKLTGLKGVLDEGKKLDAEMEEFDLEDVDGGISAILDKTIAMKADLFVSGAERCGRQSSFTGQILAARKQDSGLRNVVNVFG